MLSLLKKLENKKPACPHKNSLDFVIDSYTLEV
jgi:hypothetical protein